MSIIKLDATDSTNSYLRELYTNEVVEDFTTVIAKKQTQGRGQMGAKWESQDSKNLTFSVFKNTEALSLESPFAISLVVALALRKALQSFLIPHLYVKWPNDILSVNKKICGVLIENVIKQQDVTASIIGIGLNVNQIEFENLPKASSLKHITGIIYDLDEVALVILNQLKYYFEVLEAGNYEELKEAYESCLFRKNKPSTFEDAEGLKFSGFIKGVSDFGNLQVLLEDNIIKEFDLKEITLLY
ncbi:biotin--[acetyl-CoA-carboxylase] ligase [Tamlana sp. 2_MG-2023]|uniref:biotin--[acetyl-CoA-carboxylase] ligase n=1 Tax=unclassified Tamlana TaxID=2614803 RepID=UPI0026E30DF8|nr:MULTISPECIES: biotin--[acetyl-CoA-carboxylase] ligase [unclassified Tamlana]MDO6760271.1 biotin--[acetyl-CoA-carboxylase] ligase [Tamlana sp. 2_MG-2023]MDO6790031.1 biotin--[acetyl-CoA-carboxylase] ligase [Tamlana sp. 1_MG-2023]